MTFLNLFHKKRLIALILFGLSFIAIDVKSEPLRPICPRLEGVKFVNCLQPPVCHKSCEDFARNYLVCQSFRVCGRTCQGAIADHGCPDPSTYTMCDPRPRSRCGAECPVGTRPVPPQACTGKCYRSIMETQSFRFLQPGTCSQQCTGGFESVTECTPTEAGPICTTRQVCRRFENVCTQSSCLTSSFSCIRRYEEVANTFTGCSCLCGPTGENNPGAGNCGTPPPDQCSN